VEDYAVDITVVSPGGVVVLPDPNNPGQDILIINGTGANETITVEASFAFNFDVRFNGKLKAKIPNDAFDSVAVFAQGGNDTIIISTGLVKPTQLFGGAGNDKIHGGSGKDTIFGEAGNDQIWGRDGNDLIDGGANNDKAFGGNGNDSVLGGDGNDILHGDAGRDTVRGGIGQDSVYGDAGIDLVFGDDGNDKLFGGADRDILIGGIGKDTLQGDGGEDVLIGGTTVYDADNVALAAILSEWAGPGAYAVRVNNLRGGAGFNLESGIDVVDDGVADVLRGNADKDWFHKGVADTTPDRVVANELIN
jgi:Ca2+-binding RTX toxin-like protein